MLGRYNYSIFVPFKGINKKLFILSRLNNFITCSVHFNVQSEGSISQLWDPVRG